MLVHVYHAKSPNFGVDSPDLPDPVWPDGFEHVASVRVNFKSVTKALEEVFFLTNHMWYDWSNPTEPGVVCYVKSPRSTSVGDIAVINCCRYLCSDIGWKQLSPVKRRKVAVR